MRSKTTTLLTVVGAVTVLVLAANTIALAATGSGFLLGRTNSASKASTLKRTTSGAALNVLTRSTANPPFAVNGKGRVANLNADLLDGLDSSTLRPRTYVFTKSIPVANSTTIDFVLTIPAGTYSVGYTAALAGGAATAGGGSGCYFYLGLDSHRTGYARETRLVATGELPSFSGSGVVTVPSGDTLHFYCYAPHIFSTDTDDPIQAYATRTSVVTSTNLRAGR